MACGGVDRLGVTRGRTVAAAVIGRAEMRAALEHLAWDFYVRIAVVTCILRSAARISRNAARLWRVRLMFRRIPVGGPFPDIADHVVQAVPVRRVFSDRRGALKTVRPEILQREIALPSVGYVAAGGRELVPPSEFCIL